MRETLKYISLIERDVKRGYIEEQKDIKKQKMSKYSQLRKELHMELNRFFTAT